jgi:hypothetical protein
MIATARKLLANEPSDTDLRRAVSTAYYTLFHHLCASFSAIVLHPAEAEFVRAKRQAYRYVDHGQAKKSCEEVHARGKNFPPGIVAFADTFVELQRYRIEADYHPTAAFDSELARILIEDAEKAIAAHDSESPEARRAFAVFVALRAKGRPA